MYQLTPYSELTATYEATIASVSIQENILLVDYQNCFEESEKAAAEAAAAAAQDEGDEEDGESSNRAQKKRNSTSKVDLAGCLNRLLLEASRLEEEEEERKRQLADHQTAAAATTTTRKTSTSTSTVTSNLNSTASTASSSSSLKDLYLLQSWLNASFAFQGKGGAAGDKGVTESKKANSIHHHHHHHQSSEDYHSLLERFNLSSLAAHFDPVRRLAGNETVETFLSVSKTLIKPFFLFFCRQIPLPVAAARRTAGHHPAAQL